MTDGIFVLFCHRSALKPPKTVAMEAAFYNACRLALSINERCDILARAIYD